MKSSVLELVGVSKVFGDKKAVDNVSVTLGEGEIYGFLGPNGAGKTTTIRMIMDFIRPSKGQVRLFGTDSQHDIVTGMQNIGYLSADGNLYPTWSAEQHIKYVESVYGKSSDAPKLVKMLALDTKVPFHRLSSGNKQKLALVLAMMNRPKLLILDEPTRGLDPLFQHEIYGLLLEFKKDGGTVFMSSHNLAEVQKVCDRIGIIRKGKLVASESMSGLRKMNVHQITVQFAEPIDMTQFRARNVELVKSAERNIIVNVRGDLNTFLQQVTKHKVLDIEITHISLEEMFMRYYK